MNVLHKFSGDTVTITASADISAGQLVILGNLIGVATYPIKQGEQGVIDVRGQFDCPYVGGASATVGAKAYYDAAAGKISASGTPSGSSSSSGASNAEVGIFVKAAETGDTVCRILIG